MAVRGQSGTADTAPAATSTPTRETTPVDYTITAKTFYKSGSQNFGKFGYYVTIILDGKEHEQAVSASCYATARVEGTLAADCR